MLIDISGLLNTERHHENQSTNGQSGSSKFCSAVKSVISGKKGYILIKLFQMYIKCNVFVLPQCMEYQCFRRFKHIKQEYTEFFLKTLIPFKHTKKNLSFWGNPSIIKFTKKVIISFKHLLPPKNHRAQVHVRAKCKMEKYKSIKRKYIPGTGDSFLRKIQH